MTKAAQNYEHIGDPLRLPFARILQEVQQVRPAEAYRRFVAAGAAMLTLTTAAPHEQLRLDALKGLCDHDRLCLGRAWDQLISDMEARPYMDLLGPVYMELSHKIDRDSGGEFYTPHALSVVLARLQIGPDPSAIFTPGKILTLNEPTAGTGGMVLALSEQLFNAGISPLHTAWVVQDISDRSCHAAYINTTLWGIPAHVVCGNTLTLDYRWQWSNMHWPSARPWPTDEERAARLEADARLARMVQAMRTFLSAPAPAPAPAAPLEDFGPLFGEVAS